MREILKYNSRSCLPHWKSLGTKSVSVFAAAHAYTLVSVPIAALATMGTPASCATKVHGSARLTCPTCGLATGQRLSKQIGKTGSAVPARRG
jgi:hypothetical protein